MKINRHGKARALLPAELDALIEAAPSPQHRALWCVQRWTAARIGEALALRWGDLAAGHVTFRRSTTKTKTTRQLPQSDALRTELEAWHASWATTQGREPKAADHVFPSRFGPAEPMTRQAADAALRGAAERAGLAGTSTHSWRRSLAQAAVEAGADLRSVQAVTGHASLASLGQYLDPDPAQVLAVLAGVWSPQPEPSGAAVTVESPQQMPAVVSPQQ